MGGFILLLFLIVLLVVDLVVLAYFFYQGKKSISVSAPRLIDGKLPACGAKPNCVSSQQDKTDAHYIEPLDGKDMTLDKIAKVINAMGGVVVSVDHTGLHATFTSRIFKFVDDILIAKQGDEFHVRSSSRVGHSDLGANRRRVERMRQLLSQAPS